MSWVCHMMAYDHGANAEHIRLTIDNMPEIVNWRFASGGVFLVTGPAVTSDALGRALSLRLPGLRFIVARIDGSQAQGAADQETWDFLNRPGPARLVPGGYLGGADNLNALHPTLGQILYPPKKPPEST